MLDDSISLFHIHYISLVHLYMYLCYHQLVRQILRIWAILNLCSEKTLLVMVDCSVWTSEQFVLTRSSATTVNFLIQYILSSQTCIDFLVYSSFKKRVQKGESNFF